MILGCDGMVGRCCECDKAVGFIHFSFFLFHSISFFFSTGFDRQSSGGSGQIGLIGLISPCFFSVKRKIETISRT